MIIPIFRTFWKYFEHPSLVHSQRWILDYLSSKITEFRDLKRGIGREKGGKGDSFNRESLLRFLIIESKKKIQNYSVIAIVFWCHNNLFLWMLSLGLLMKSICDCKRSWTGRCLKNRCDWRWISWHNSGNMRYRLLGSYWNYVQWSVLCVCESLDLWWRWSTITNGSLSKSLDQVAFYEAFIPFESVSIEKNRRSETDRIGLLKIRLTDFSERVHENFIWFLLTISWTSREVHGSVGNLLTSSIASQTLKRVDPIPSMPFSFSLNLQKKHSDFWNWPSRYTIL
jgi:hypothetical protein